jgi:cell division protein FtsQ
VFVVLHSSLFAISGVKVQGAVETSPRQIIVAAGLSNHPPLIDVNSIAVALKVESLPWIASATVVRHWPKSVTIAVTERVPIAEANVAKHSWELFDRQGRALGYRPIQTRGLVRIQKQTVMTRPGAIATGAIGGEISLADALPIHLSPEIREVGYTSKDGIIVNLSGGTIAIFGGADALADKVVALNTLFANHVSLIGVKSVDLRVPSSPVLSTTSPKS